MKYPYIQCSGGPVCRLKNGFDSNVTKTFYKKREEIKHEYKGS